MPTQEYDGVVTSESIQSDDDKRLVVEFYMAAVKDEGKSAEAGRPIFNDVPMIKIITPGSRDVYTNKALQVYRERFPKHWDRFQRRIVQIVEGTPLEEVPFLTVSQIAELKALNCLTLEQLAGIADTHGSKFMGFNGIKAKAVAYLEAAKSAAPITQLKAELERRDAEIITLQQQVALLMTPKEVARPVGAAKG